MKQRPILFKDDMIRAILEGRKTQTRRAMKPQPEAGLEFTPFAPFGVVNGKGNPLICRHGKPGDRLWVRETWWQAGDWFQTHPEDDEYGRWSGSRRVVYAADCNPPNEPNRSYPEGLRGGSFSAADPWRIWRKRPSIHMPRWASRITLEVTSVRAERLNDISVEDAQSEGCAKPDLPPGLRGVAGDFVADERTTFAILWNRINGRGAWAENPWVWVIEFRRIKP